MLRCDGWVLGKQADNGQMLMKHSTTQCSVQCHACITRLVVLLTAPLQQAAHNVCAPILCRLFQSITKLIIAWGVVMSAQQLVTCVPQLMFNCCQQGLRVLEQ
jgi:hypothetical protein